ncbi:MAG: leucyl/phenylalanyl-tRNA--protein transferase [Rhizobacter sp.]|nr:leucyl/phenylalanyl-tRNA--protein transferase [Rhizobacter sp.]
MITWIVNAADALPDTRLALGPDSEAPGLLAAGGELTPQRLREAYRKGVFPWYSDGQPVLWWSPDPRMVLPVAEFRPSHSLRKTLRRFMRSPHCEVRIDTAFRRVIEACAGTPREGQPGTWIVEDMIDAYTRLHELGTAHSVETWIDGELVGGLYGVSLGRMVYGESMFAHRTDASKIALSALVAFCRHHGVSLIDCQQNTAHLSFLGAHEISKAAFEQHLSRVSGAEPITDWSYHHSMWAHLGLDAAGPQEESGS